MADPDAAIEVGRLPVVEESLRVAKRRRVTGTVRVAVATREAEEAIATVRRSRLAEIERVRVDREVDAPPPVRQEGDMVVIPVLEERLVLVRRLVVTEEIRFRLRMEEEPVTLTAAVRRQEVDVSRRPAGADATRPDASRSDAAEGEAFGVQHFSPKEESHHMQRTLTAMFDSRHEAERAAEALRGLGIGAAHVRLHGAEQGSGHGGTVATGSADHGTGLFSGIGDLFVPDEDRATYHEGLRRGATLVSAQVDEAHIDTAMDAMEAAGAVDLDSREASWRQEGWTGASVAGGSSSAGMALGTASDGSRTGIAAMDTGSTGSNPPGTMLSRGVDQVAGTNISGAHPEHERGTATHSGATHSSAHAAGHMAGREEVIPIAEERLRVGKREAHAGRVRVRSYVVETPVEEQVRLREERVHVERHAVDRPVTGAEADLFRERVIEAEESIEEAVVQKDVRITGEVVVNKDVTERTETIRDSVRRTEVEVDEDSVANDKLRRDNKGVA